MKKYVIISQKLFVLSLRLRMYKRTANDYYCRDLIIPTSLIIRINTLQKKCDTLRAYLEMKEDIFCELLPFELLEIIINTGVSVKI